MCKNEKCILHKLIDTFPKSTSCFCFLSYKAIFANLFDPQYPGSSPLPRLDLLLIPLLKSNRILVRPTEVIKVLDLVNSDDPVLTGESLLERRELGALGWKLAPSHTVSGLTRGEERVVVVVAHLVHERIAHGWRRLVINTVLAACGEEIALLDFVGPDAYRTLLAISVEIIQGV